MPDESSFTNPLEDPDFEVQPEDVQEPAPEQWPPSEEHWPARPPLHERVQRRPDFWGALKTLRK